MSRRVWSALLAVAACGAARAEEDPAAAAARAREQAVRTARFEVHVREVHAAGSAARGNALFPAVPTGESTAEWDGVLVLSGDKVRVETELQLVRPAGLVPLRQIAVIDGDREVCFYPNGPVRGEPLRGTVQHHHGTTAVKNLWWRPVTMTVRGLTPVIVSYPLDQLAPTDQTEVIGGHRCREYRVRQPRPPLISQERFWFDPDAGYTLCRFRLVTADRKAREAQVRYRKDAAAGWLPSEWTEVEYDRDGRAAVTFTATVTAVRVNEPVSDEDFRLTFPAGTQVADAIARKNFRVQPDGTWAEFDPLAPDPADAPPPSEAVVLWRRVLVGAGLTVGLTALLVGWFRLRAARAKTA